MCKGDEMTVRSSLPKNYIKKDGTLIDDFSSLTGWSNSIGTGSFEADTTNVKTGSQSIKLIPSGAGVTYGIQKSITPVMMNGYVGIWCYLHDEPSTIDKITVILGTAANLWGGYMKWEPRLWYKGWNFLGAVPDDWTISGTGGFNQPVKYVLVEVNSHTGQLPHVSFDKIMYGQETINKCVVVFDDSRLSGFTKGYAYMKQKGLTGKATFSTVPYYVDAYNGDYADLTDVQAAYDDGCCICSHTYHHTSLTSVTLSEARTEIESAQTWLKEKGFTRGLPFIVYPGGLINDDIINQILIPDGFLAGRGTQPTNYIMPPIHQYNIPSISLSTTSTLASLKTSSYKAFKVGSTLFLMVHGIVDSNASDPDCLTSDFQAAINWLIANNWEFVTFDEWEKGLSNPRYVNSVLR
jgi:peptidoglycan/xylan/chitin deacetylase (PgdA/CDA1 family)